MSSRIDRFAIESTVGDRDVMVRVVGDVDMATAGFLAAELAQAVEGFDGAVTVNMAGVTFLDSAGLCALLRAHTALDTRGRRLVVTSPARAASRTFELAGLLDTFHLATQPD
jgi:anti-sigma B factor antagonist